MSQAPVYSIGHSNHPIERFLDLLARAGIATVVDVRSAPASRRFPQFGKARLTETLRGAGVEYVFAGDVLGGRPKDADLWHGGRPDYKRMITAAGAKAALADVRARSARAPTCLMCSEKEPLDCHRCLMVARALVAEGVPVRHILADGTIEEHPATERRLLTWAERRQPELFATAGERLDAAFEKRADWLWKTGPGKGWAK